MMIHCKIVTPNGLYAQLDTKILNIVTTDGQRGILPNHMPLVTTLAIGKMTTEEADGRKNYALSGGLLHFANNEAVILVDSIENENEIDVERALAARERALSYLNSQDPNVDYRRAEVALKRAMNRLQVKGYELR
ncbi:MAG: ATP synthase F1 subunit epsilon [Erysipelotrichaceae bacterium]|nr:ATP synthase F1 subunit epsilon [Erysipelotrichaceae bacterium]MDY5252393.1 ATP synthase F1 subunit epsilon [Erysipelotrichaceae bacterium]